MHNRNLDVGRLLLRFLIIAKFQEIQLLKKWRFPPFPRKMLRERYLLSSHSFYSITIEENQIGIDQLWFIVNIR